MRYTTTDGPKKPLNAIQEGSLGDKMGIAGVVPMLLNQRFAHVPDAKSRHRIDQYGRTVRGKNQINYPRNINLIKLFIEFLLLDI